MIYCLYKLTFARTSTPSDIKIKWFDFYRVERISIFIFSFLFQQNLLYSNRPFSHTSRIVKKSGTLPGLLDKHKLDRVQERALCVIYPDRTSSYEDLFKKANLDALNERRLKDILFLVYKVKHQMVPGYLEDIVKRNDLKPYILRNSDLEEV